MRAEVIRHKPYRVVMVTLDAHAAGPAQKVETALGVFLEEHVKAILPDLKARRDSCDAIVCTIAASEIVRLTRMGKLDMAQPASGALKLIRKLRGTSKPSAESGERKMALLRRLPKILKFIPGKSQDLRAWFMCMQYWLGSSDDNLEAMVRLLIQRYSSQPDMDQIEAPEPINYPETGVYHPRLKERITTDGAKLPRPRGHTATIGLLLMRSYILSGDTAHYDSVISALEKRGIAVVPAFASGLDNRPAIEAYFAGDKVDALVSLTGFSLVGGPAYNDSAAAEEILAKLDVPYLAAHPLEFQTLEQWETCERGLGPIETTMLIALPEIDGATNPTVFAGRHSGSTSRGMSPCPERVEVLADRAIKLARLRRSARADRKLGIVLFGFPPNAGAVGTAAYLSVFESLFNTLNTLHGQGYQVELPDSVDALRKQLLEGNAERYGQQANVAAKISADRIVSEDPHLAEVEAQWGPAPGKAQADGSGVFVLGAEFGNVFVGVQPAFGYEGDPMRLLFEKGFAPTHAFCAFYRYLNHDFGADVLLHFGMHGALEFMPGKQTGMSGDCWPDRLIGDLPNVYLYAANNPSEATLAKRRANAVTISHLTPPLSRAGLYKGLIELKESLISWRGMSPSDAQREALEDLVREQAESLDLDARDMDQLWQVLLVTEAALIPDGLHIVGATMEPKARSEHLDLMAVEGEAREIAEAHLNSDSEMIGLLNALDGRFTRPVPGGDIIRNPEILPTGRNIHAFDPFRMPTAFAMQDGARQAQLLLDTHANLPESIALVLWGSDNIKSDGGPIAQALSLMGARPRFDEFGRLSGADLISLEELGRPRIDVVMTLSGIFRDLLPLQVRMLAEAAFKAASADEPLEQNFIRAHALAYAERMGCDLETASLRVFSNAEGAYGANVNQLIDSGAWDGEEDLANAYFDTLGGISRAVKRAKGEEAPVYIGDQTRGDGKVRTLSDQVALETRSRALNPKWYEGLLRHGHEGVHMIESHITNTVGWSATSDAVEPWVYQRLSETFVLDEEMRRRLGELNPAASARMANRLLEAHEREFWQADADTLEALQSGADELEDRLEGIHVAAE